MYKKDFQLIQRIKEIENGTFSEDCIKLLLIEIREELQGEVFLREVCDFVAHPNRNKGICHKKVDVRYAKLKLVKDNTLKNFTQDFIEANKDKPERFFTDVMLNYINTDKIEKHLFELVILSGIEDIDKELFIEYYRMSRKQVTQLIKSSYQRVGKYYNIKPSLSVMKYHLVDDILKFIRGTVTGKPAFTQNEIYKDFITGVRKLCHKLNYDFQFEKIKNHKEDLIVIIIALLHDCTFDLFDGAKGVGFLSVHSEENEDFVICLMSQAGHMSLPLITTNIPASKYINVSESAYGKFNLKKIPWVYCKRDSEGKLMLDVSN